MSLPGLRRFVAFSAMCQQGQGGEACSFRENLHGSFFAIFFKRRAHILSYVTIQINEIIYLMSNAKFFTKTALGSLLSVLVISIIVEKSYAA